MDHAGRRRPAQVLEIRPGQRQSLRPCRLRVPPGQGYVVGDIRNAGKTIDFGAQNRGFHHHQAGRTGDAHRAECGGAFPGMPRRGPAACRRRWAPPSGIAALPDLPLRSRSAVGDAGTTGTAAAPSWWQQEVEWLPKSRRKRLSWPGCRRGCAGVEAVEADDSSPPPALLPYPKLPEEKRSRPAWYPVRSWPTPHRIPLMPSPRSFSTAHSAPSSSASTISAPIT